MEINHYNMMKIKVSLYVR